MQAEVLDTWIIAGQSNAEGYGITASPVSGLTPADTLSTIARSDLNVTHGNIQMFQGANEYSGITASAGLTLPPKDTWHSMNAQEGLAYDWGAGRGGESGRRFGPELAFGYDVQAQIGTRIALIKYARGSASIASSATQDGLVWRDFDPSDGGRLNQYDKLITTIQTAVNNLPAGQVLNVRGVLWMQGEGDATATFAPAYQANLTEFITTLRKDIGTIAAASGGKMTRSASAWSKLDVFLGTIQSSTTNHQTVINAQNAVAAADANVHTVNASTGLSTMTVDDWNISGLHYDTAGQVLLGERFADAALSRLQLDNGIHVPNTVSGGTGTLAGIQAADGVTYDVIKGGTLSASGFEVVGGDISSVVLHVKFSVQSGGYTGTNSLLVNGVSTGIAPVSGDANRTASIDITAGNFKIDTWPEIAALAVSFLNNDGGSGQSVLFDHVYLVVTHTTPSYSPPTWSDEFNDSGAPNPAIWTFEQGFTRNEELQWYQSNNAWQESGNLIIEGRREQVLNPNYVPGDPNWKLNRQYANYTSSSIVSQGKYSFKYGRMQVRAKLPCYPGSWPAIWTIGTVGEWPSNGECDILEYYQPDSILANCARGSTTRWSAAWDSVKKPLSPTFTILQPNWRDEYHVWTMQWDDQNVRLYVDNHLMNTTAQSWLVNPVTTWGPLEPFKEKHFILLNLAIGGAGGDPSGTAYPIRYLLDYVRVWEGLTENTSPNDIALSPNTIQEGLAAGTVVGTLSASDDDAAEIHTYSLVAGTGDTHNASFEIVPLSDSTRTSILRTKSVLNYVDGATRSIRVRVTDIEGATYDKILTINVGSTGQHVTYNGNGNDGGSVPVDPVGYPQGTTVTVPGNTGALIRTGYAFAGWNTAANGGGTTYAGGTTFAMGATDVTLYAKWTAVSTYTVSYNGNSQSSGTAPGNQTKTQGVNIALATNAGNLARTGYTFAGWNTLPGGTGTNYAVGANYTTDATVTLYAKWNALPVANAGIPQTVSLSAGQSWTPASVTTAAWYDAADAASITHTSGAVSQWNDKSGNGRHVIQATSANQPTYNATSWNGSTLPALTFDGTSNYLENASQFVAASLTIVAVYDQANTSNSSRPFGVRNGGSGKASFAFASDNSLRYDGTYTAGTIAASVGKHLRVAGRTTSAQTDHMDGTSNISAAVVLPNVDGNINIGNTLSTLAGYFSSKVAETIVIPGTINQATREQIEGYLAHKWALTANLPALHPYKSTAPTTSSAIATLAGSASDPEGLGLTTAWSIINGPGTVTFGNSLALNSTATFPVAGTYTLRLTVSDGMGTSSSDVVVTVNPAGSGYTITFDSVGGSAVAPITQASGTAVTAPTAPTKPGYTFTGWNPAVPATMPTSNTTCVAQWTANSYTITFDSAGGTAVSSITQAYGTAVTGPAAPTKVGYTFAGWVPAVPSTMPTSTTCVAQWTANSYTITFDSAGGTAVSSITQAYGTAVTGPPAPTKTGYTFAGWTPVVPSTMPASNTNCVAQWTANSYTITFNSDGGTAVSSITQAYGTAVTAPAAPTKTGYTFAGWTPSVPSTMPASNTTCVAQWTANTYTITFNSDGGTAVSSITQVQGTTVTAPTAPTKTGYTFAGWTPSVPATMPASNTTCVAQWTANSYTITFDSVGGTAVSSITQAYGTAVTAPAAPTKTGYTFASWVPAIPATMPIDTSCVAQWTANNYTVTFDKQSGTGGSDSVSAIYGSAMPTAIVPIRTGYTFGGYYTEVDGGGTQYYTAAMTSAATWDLTTATTLYAKWSLGADGTWIQTTAGPFDWGVTANWSGGVVAEGTDKTASFTPNITAAQTVNLEAAHTIGNITFTDPTTSFYDLTISGANALTLATSSGNPTINVTQSGRKLTISSQISGSNGLKKDGAGNLTLSGTNDYTGGTVINAGTLAVSANTNLGDAAGAITFNGNASLASSISSTLVDLGSRSITLNNGAVATFTSTSNRANMTIGGAVTGSGGVTAGVAGTWAKYSFNSTSNTFTGAITDNRGTNDSIANALFSFNSIADGADYGNIILNGATNCGIDYGSGAIVALTLNNRQIVLSNTSAVFFNNASSQAVNINTDIGFSGSGARQIRFGISGRSGSGNSTFAGKLSDNVDGAFSPTVNGGTWVFSKTDNTYTGPTTVSAGTLSISSIANFSSPSSIGAAASGTIVLGNTTTTGTLLYTGDGDESNRTIQINSSVNTNTGGAAIINNGTGALTFTASPFNDAYVNASASTRMLTFGGTNGGTVNGVIQDNSATSLVGIGKSGTGTWTLKNTNTNTGASSVTGGGNLILDYTSTGSKFGDAAALTLGSGTLTLKGGAHTEIVGSTTLAAGATFITRNGGTSVLQMNDITRQTGGAISFLDGTVATTDKLNTNGILGGWATIGNDWAINSTNGADGPITALPSASYTGALPLSGTGSISANYTLTGGQVQTGTATLSAHTVKLQGTGETDNTLAIGATTIKIITSAHTGGILYVGGGTGVYNITADPGKGFDSGTINRDLIITTVTGTLNVSAKINTSTSSAGLLKAGAGTLILSSTENAYTGVTTVCQGTLMLVGGNQASPITVAGGASLGFTLGSPVTSSSSVDFSSGTVTITGTPTLASYTLMTASGGFTGTPVLSSLIPGCSLIVEGTQLKLLNTQTNTAPVWASNPITGSNATEDIAYSGSITSIATDADSDPLTFAKVSGPTWLSVAANGTLSGTPANSDVGANVFTVSVSDGTAPAVTATLNITVKTAYETWAIAQGLTGGDALPGADKDGDGLNNLHEYAFGTHPNVAGGGALAYVAGGALTNPGQPIALDMIAGAGVDYRAVFCRRKDHVAAGITYTVQFSASLNNDWVDSITIPTILTGDNTQNPGDIEVVSVPYPLSIPVTGGFFRVIVSMP